MSDINSSLIGFLKKKTLFSNSPQKKQYTRSRSKQRTLLPHKADTPRKQSLDHSYQQMSLHSIEQRSPNNSHQYEFTSTTNEKKYNKMMTSTQKESHQKQINTDQIKKPVHRNFQFKNPERKQQARPYITAPKDQANLTANISNTNPWSNVVNHAGTFESARIQSKQCIENLSLRLQAQISNINFKIDAFNSQMQKFLNKEFKNLHMQILTIVDKIFAESQAHIRTYIKRQEEVLAGELISMRATLRNQHQKIQIMKQEINKPQWRKAAGELISSELEYKVEELISNSKNIDIGHWEIGDLGANKIKALEFQLRQIITLST